MVASNEQVPSLAIPLRPEGSMTGSQFVSTIFNMPLGPERELAISQQLQLGNVPNFMRTLRRIEVSGVTIAGGKKTAVYWVTPDYLCIGTDEDYVRMPMWPGTATEIANVWGAFLPTRRVVNDVFSQGDVKLLAKNLSPTDKMTSVKWLMDHNAVIQQQLAEKQVAPGMLVVGHKKDVVLCRALFDGHHDDRVAIYGWCRAFNGTWEPWQPLNPDSHSNQYADYSHGIRLIAAEMYVNGDETTYDTVLEDRWMAGLLSDEGTLVDSRYPGTP